MPQASRMRPTSRASAGQRDRRERRRRSTAGALSCEPQAVGLGLSDQALDRRRQLRAVAGPMLDAVERDAQRLLAARGDRVVEADALDEAAVAAQPRIGDDDVEERTLLGAATGKADHDHDGIPRRISKKGPAVTAAARQAKLRIINSPETVTRNLASRCPPAPPPRCVCAHATDEPPPATAPRRSRPGWRCWAASLGVHRFYLHGWGDVRGWLLWLPTLAGTYGVLRMRSLGQDDLLAWLLIPLLGLTIALTMLSAIRCALTPDAQWDARHNPGGSAASIGALNVLAAAFALAFGTIALMASIAFMAQRYFENATDGRDQSKSQRLAP